MKELLRAIETVAVIGCSSNTYRTSHHIASYLQENGIRIVPINPNETEVLGEKSYDTIMDLPDEVDVDIVDIFRNKRYTREMVQEIVEWSRETGQLPVVWTQLDVSTEPARELAKAHGLDYVENRCLMVEHRRVS
ncbi:MAG: CoA-binding protein [Balneolaceae bacterium]